MPDRRYSHTPHCSILSIVFLYKHIVYMFYMVGSIYHEHNSVNSDNERFMRIEENYY